MARSITRRGFLRGAGALTLTLSLGRLRPCALATAAPGSRPSDAGAEVPAYRSWEDIYRRKWTWDTVHKGTHFVNCWYQRGCNFDVYVKEGLVFREEQSGTYPQTNPTVPDFNPRGCQKGACYSQRMYDAGRLRYPLKRVGPRGEGKWKRISWEEGLRQIADRTIDALLEDGPGSITWDPGTANTNGCNGLGIYRTAFVLDTPILDVNAEVGDHHPGALATAGKISFASSGDDLFYSDLILIWGGNPIYTQIPNAHFINEARYHGARVVSIAPDFNASSIHADLWIPINIGTDAALGLSMAQVIVEEGLYDARFIAEQTDMPLLVRSDTRLFLRKSDLEKGGDEDVFYVFDTASGTIREVSQRTLALGGLEPALEGEYTVATLEGEVQVTTVFEQLRRRLSEYAPEATAEITGIRAEVVRDLARQIAKARAATVITQSAFSKYYHGLDMERVQILVITLCGQVGKKGSGFNAFPAMTTAGVAPTMMSSGSLSPRVGSLFLMAKAIPSFVRMRLQGLTDEMIVYQMTREEYRNGRYLAGALFHYAHGGLDGLYGASARWDPAMKRELKDYLAESLEKGWQVAPPTVRQRIFFEVGGNILRRTRGYDRRRDELLPKLDLLVTLDWRMSTTALHSDYVFPAAAWYEKDDITWATPIAPFAHVTTRAVEPYAESKSDWEFHCLFLKQVQERAKERGLETFVDRAGQQRSLDQVYDQFTFGGLYTEDNPEELLDALLSVTTNLGDIGWKELREKGFERYSGLGFDVVNLGNATDIEPGETVTANTWHTEEKLPWPTLTRRIQFYIDHPFYLELGGELPVHKDPPKMGGDYPLQMTGQHARWSIHATWRDNATLLRLQRGEPLIIMSTADARARGLEDEDLASVRNDIGSFEAQVKVSPTVRPGQVIVNHAWEPYQFKRGVSHQSIIPSPINPLQLAGGYFHLQPTMLMGEAGGVDRGTAGGSRTRVTVRPLPHPPPPRHLGPCSLLDLLSSRPAPDSLEAYARRDLTNI
jgi:DMSO reductase family type II enzyme molybdopterin subunit